MPRARQLDWPIRAAAVAAAVPLTRMHPRVLAWVDENRRSRRPWLVACSGGADSMLLLLLVWAHWPSRRERLVVVHFDHRLRGAAAAADARWCQQVARGLGVACEVGTWQDRPSLARVTETAARLVRQRFFAEALRLHRARALWLGHQLDDVAETFFMRLARGSGTAGLAAPRPVQTLPGGRVNLRPLLGLGKAEIGAILRAADVPWREDASNATPVHLRNRMRRDVLPAWIEMVSDRDALAGAGLSRDRLEEDDEALEAWLDELAALTADDRLHLEVLRGRPTALWRRALHRWLARQPVETDLSRAGFEALLTALRGRPQGRFSLTGQAFAVWRRGYLDLLVKSA
jgi:tRNA(Ile)-lysidine synthase